MRLLDVVRLSCGYTLRRRWRAVPSLLGVALGVAVLVLVFTGAETINRTGSDQILGQLSLRQITVSSSSTPGGANVISRARIAQLGGLTHVTAAYPVAETTAVAQVGDAGYVVPVRNLPVAADRPSLLSGHWPVGSEIVLPESGLRGKTGALVPGEQLIGKTLVLQVRSLQGLGTETSVPLEVVGTFRLPRSRTDTASGYAPLSVVDHLLALAVGEADEQYLPTATYPVCIVDVDAAQNVGAVGSAIEARGLMTSYVEKQVSGLSGHLQGIQLTAAYVAFAVILLCALSVGNMVASSVRQRRSELGIMLAVGFGHGMLAGVVAGEAFVTGLAGALIGIIVALLGIGIFAATHPSAGVVLPGASLLVVALLSAFLCLLAGLLPARKVMRMDCVEALRSE